MDYTQTQRLVKRLITCELGIDNLPEEEQASRVALEVASYGDVFSPLTWEKAFVDKQSNLLLEAMDEPSYFLEVHLIYFSGRDGWYELLPKIMHSLVLKDSGALDFMLKGFLVSRETPEYGASVDGVKALEGEIVAYGQIEERRWIELIQSAGAAQRVQRRRFARDTSGYS